MALSKGTSEDAAMREDSQVNFAKSFVDFLKQHREVLPTLPEILERLISNEASESQNFDLSREDEQNVLAKRKKADSRRHFKSMREKLAKKDERIKELENIIREKDVQIDAMERPTSFPKQEQLSKDEEDEVSRWKNYCLSIKSRNDEYIKEAEVKEEKLEELRDSKEEQIREYTNRFHQLKEQFEGVLSGKDEELNQLNFSNEDVIQQFQIKEDQVKEFEAKYKKLTEEYYVLLDSKDKELMEMKTRHDEQIRKMNAKDETLMREYVTGCTQLKEKYETLLADKEKELNQAKTSCTQLKEKYETLLADKEKELNLVKPSCAQLKERYDAFLEEKEKELNLVTTRFKQLKFILANKEEELKGMKTRLAYLSEKQVKKDQRKVEDTNASNRPSEVERDFDAFMDGDRIDAFDKMQEVYGSEEEIDIRISYPRLACIIFEASYEQTKETKEAVLDLFKGIIATMIDTAPKMGQEFSSSVKNERLPSDIHFRATEYNPESDYPTDVLDALELSMKESAHECNLESLEQDVSEKIKEKWLLWLSKDKSCDFSFSYSILEKLSDYIKACIRLTWRMVTQVPPMQLEYQSSTLTEIHKNLGYHSSPEMCSRRTTNGQASDEELEIACYLWPALQDGGGKLIRAGEVLCKVKVENTVI